MKFGLGCNRCGKQKPFDLKGMKYATYQPDNLPSLPIVKSYEEWKRRRAEGRLVSP